MRRIREHLRTTPITESPYETLAAALLAPAGAAMLLTGHLSLAVEHAFGTGVATAWMVFLVLGGALNLIGLLRPKARVEVLGLGLMLTALAQYAYATLKLGGWSTLLGFAVVLVLVLGSAIRITRITRGRR